MWPVARQPVNVQSWIRGGVAGGRRRCQSSWAPGSPWTYLSHSQASSDCLRSLRSGSAEAQWRDQPAGWAQPYPENPKSSRLLPHDQYGDWRAREHPLGHASQKHVLGAAGPACTDDNDVGRPALGRAEQPFERAPGHEHRLHRPAGGPEHIRCAVHETLTGALLLDVNFAANPAPRCANFGGHQAQRGHTRRIQDVHDSDVAAGRARTHGLVQFADPERGGAHSPLIGGALCDPRGVPPEPTDIVPGAARPPVWAPRKGTKTRLPTWRDNCHTRAVGSCWRRRREVTQVLPPAGIAAARRPPLRSPFGHLAPRRARA
jgi:hypothetical protein